MDARAIPQDQIPEMLQSYRDENGVPRQGGHWGWFGWEGWCVDRAIDLDDPDCLRWCHEQGFITPATATLFNTPLRSFCAGPYSGFVVGNKQTTAARNVRAPRCAEALEALGYPA